MTPDLKQKLLTSEADALQRVNGFKNGGTIPCEYTQCTCAERCRVNVRTFSLIVKPDVSIELVCFNGMQHFAKLTNIDL